MLKFFFITIFIFINKILNENVYNFENLWKFTTENIKKSESNYFLVDPNNFLNENDKNSISQMQKHILDKNNVYSYIFVVEKLQENSNDFFNKFKEDLLSNIKSSFNDKEKNSIIFLFSIKDEKCLIKSGEEISKNILNLQDFSFDNNDQYLKEKNYNLFIKKYLHDFIFFLENPVQKEKNEPKEENKENSNNNNNNNNNENNNNNNNNSNNNNNNENDDSKQSENDENKNNENSNQNENKNPENNNDENINNEKNRENSKNDFDFDDDDDEKKGIGFLGKFLIFCVIAGLFYFGYYYYYKRKKKVGILNFNYDNYNKMNNNSGQELSNNEFAYYK